VKLEYKHRDYNGLSLGFPALGRDWPKLGVWGSGNITPEFELEPSGDLTDLLPYLALRQGDKVFWSNAPHSIAATPWGAGLCARCDGTRIL
jgi:hypothetical protein